MPKYALTPVNLSFGMCLKESPVMKVFGGFFDISVRE